MASIGVIPRATSYSNSFASLISVQGNPPASVPKTIFTPALRQFSKERAWIFADSAQIAQPAAARGPET
jgi:hypothetical protein